LSYKVDHAIVDVNPKAIEKLAVLGERVLVEDPHAVTKYDRVRDLHHRGLDVQREHHAVLTGILDLALVEGAQRLLAHEHRVDDLPGLQRDLGFQDQCLAALGDQLHLDFTSAVQGHRLLAMVEVAAVHVRHMRARGLRPFGHRVRVLACVLLHCARRAAVGVPFA
jgi:hypothetical protein